MKTNQHRAHALITQADDFRQRGRLDDAIAAYREAIRLVPAFGALNLVVGDLLFTLQRCAEAAEAYRAALDALPEEEHAWSRLGQCQLVLGQYEDAQNSLEKVLALNPNNAEANYYLAVMSAHNGDSRKAARHLRRALHLRPQWEAQARAEKRLSGLVDQAAPKNPRWMFWRK